MEVWYEAQSQLANTPALHCSPLSPVLAWLVGTSAIFLSRLLRPIQLPRGVNWVSILRYCGLLTFPVYLIHDDVGLVIEDRLSMFGFDSAALAAIAVVLVLSMLVTSFVEPPLARSLKVFLRRVFLKEVRGPLSAQPGAANRL
jgi:peptidoglycan/LPS O-acetylase OafA/YrhL